jgi:hypothetical protein
MNRRQALIGYVALRVGLYMFKRLAGTKGGVMASKKKVGVIAGIGAGLGALMFWRRRKSKQQDFFEA